MKVQKRLTRSTGFCWLLFFAALLAPGTSQVPIYGEPCPVELPQKSSKQCQDSRLDRLKHLKSKIQLVPPFPGEPIRVINMTFDQLKKHLFDDPFERYEFSMYLLKTDGGTKLMKQWIDKYGQMKIKDFTDYAKIYGFFRKGQKYFGTNFRIPSDEEPFRNIIQDFMEDQVFAEQRLAGVNPMSMYRVASNDDPNGLKWSKLKQKLNPNFDWEGAVQDAIGRKIPLEKAIKNKLVFALQYPLLDNLPTSPDIMEHNPSRKMWKSTSPIALFIVKPGNRRNLQPAAIQMDSKQNSLVYTPKDKHMWLLAKMTVQGADLGYNQMVEHLAKTHLLMEPFCVSKERHLSEYHPLHQILKYHCRGISVTDQLAFSVLLGENMYLHKLFAYGYSGVVSLALRAYRQASWEDTDFPLNIEKRGLDKSSLTYFPYRDDGSSIHFTIKKLVTQYINIYYKCDLDVQKDYELQYFLNELSASGGGHEGGLGQIKGLPNKVSSKIDLIDLLKRLIWQMSAQHSAINYPMTDYGAYTLNTPTKLYSDDRVPSDRFTLYNLPNANITATQALVALSLGNFRYDSLFDYGPELSHKPARQVVSKWFTFLQGRITRTIEARNNRRLNEGHLTYPYLIPRWIPNGIQT